MLCARHSFYSHEFFVGSVEVVESQVFLSDVLNGIGSTLSGHLGGFDEVVNGFAVLFQLGLEDLVVDNLGSSELGEHQPAEKSKFKPGEVGDHVEDESSEGLDEGEDSVDHPVSQPVLVIVSSVLRLDSADGVDGGVEHSHEESEHLPSVDAEDGQSDESKTSSDQETRVDSNFLSSLLEGSKLVTIGV